MISMPKMDVSIKIAAEDFVTYQALKEDFTDHGYLLYNKYITRETTRGWCSMKTKEFCIVQFTDANNPSKKALSIINRKFTLHIFDWNEKNFR